MKPKTWIVLPLVFLLGCASLTPDRIAVLAAIAGQAAQVGAAQWLKDHPEHKPAFDAVIIAIGALMRGGVTNQTAYAELLNSLPTATLAGPEGAVYVTEDRVNIWDEKTQKAYDVSNEIPVQRAIVAGLKRATAPMPPVPTANVVPSRLKSFYIVPVGVPVNEANLPPGPRPMTDAELDAEFEAFLKARGKTNAPVGKFKRPQ